jgi:hypothetical protein
MGTLIFALMLSGVLYMAALSFKEEEECDEN